MPDDRVDAGRCLRMYPPFSLARECRDCFIEIFRMKSYNARFCCLSHDRISINIHFFFIWSNNAMFQLLMHKPGIVAVALKQLVMWPFLHDGSLVYYQNHVGVADGTQAVSDNDLCTGQGL